MEEGDFVLGGIWEEWGVGWFYGRGFVDGGSVWLGYLARGGELQCYCVRTARRGALVWNLGRASVFSTVEAVYPSVGQRLNG